MKKNQVGSILKDKNSRGKDRKWRERKKQNMELAKALQELGYLNFSNVYQCAEVLKFQQIETGQLKLKQTWFCKNKLCPICNWRRSMKYAWQTEQIVNEAIIREPKGRFLFLTLTIKNVEGKDLEETMKGLTKAFDRLFRRAKVKKNLLGYLRSLEITLNEETGLYHPHLHILLFVSASYFNSTDNYISQKEWSEMWQQSAKLDYLPIVDVRAVKSRKNSENQEVGLKKAILETAKYPTKPINFDRENLEIIDNLAKALYRKRQIGYGGIFKDIRKELFLDDVENGDLIHASEDEKGSSEGQEIVAIWNWERLNYFIK